MSANCVPFECQFRRTIRQAMVIIAIGCLAIGPRKSCGNPSEPRTP